MYVRRSHKDVEGSARNGRSLMEQEAEARAYAESRGLTVVDVFTEREGTGASRRSGKARPAWAEALRALEDGSTFQTLVVWELSRADRRGWAALDGIVERLAEKGRRLLGVDGTDLTNPKDRMMNVLRAEMAREEAEKIGERVARAKRADRARGVWLGGRTPFGLTTDEDGRLTPDPETAPTARAIVDAVLGGSSLWAVAKTLNGDASTVAGLKPTPSVRGGRWTVGTLSAWLRSPSLAGLATDRARAALSDGGRWAATGSVLRDEEGRPVALGVGIVTPDEHDRLAALLSARTVETGRRAVVSGAPTRTVVGRGRAAAHLLGAGLGRCSCGASLQIYGTTARNPMGSLRCSSYGLTGGCPAGKPGQGPREAVERYVLRSVNLALVLAREADAPLWRSVVEAWKAAEAEAETEEAAEARRAVEAARSALERIEDAYADGLLDARGYARQVERLTERLAAAEAEAARHTTTVVPAFDEAEPWAVLQRWMEDPETGTAERRRLVSLVAESVTLLPAAKQGVRFDPEARVVIAWREPGVEVAPSVLRGAAS